VAEWNQVPAAMLHHPVENLPRGVEAVIAVILLFLYCRYSEEFGPVICIVDYLVSRKRFCVCCLGGTHACKETSLLVWFVYCLTFDSDMLNSVLVSYAI
jgi:hypothetical protein